MWDYVTFRLVILGETYGLNAPYVNEARKRRIVRESICLEACRGNCTYVFPLEIMPIA